MAARKGGKALNPLSREEILALRQVREVEVPDMGVFLIRPLSARQGIDLGIDGKADDAIGMKMIALCLVNPDGSRIFGDDESDMLAEALPAKALPKLSEAILESFGTAAPSDNGSFGTAQPGDNSTE